MMQRKIRITPNQVKRVVGILANERKERTQQIPSFLIMPYIRFMLAREMRWTYAAIDAMSLQDVSDALTFILEEKRMSQSGGV